MTSKRTLGVTKRFWIGLRSTPTLAVLKKSSSRSFAQMLVPMLGPAGERYSWLSNVNKKR